MKRACIDIGGIIVAIIMITSVTAVSAKAEEPRDEADGKNAAVHILDGKKFKGQTGEKGKKPHHVDVLIFDHGRFTSSECFQFGFGGGPYTATVRPDSIQFNAVTRSPTHGVMEWSGELRGNTLEVTYTWTKKRWLWTTHRKYWFKGKLVE